MSSKGSKKYLIVSNDGYARGYMTYNYFKKRLSDLGLSGKVKVEVAGLIPSKGLEPASLAVRTLKNHQIPQNGFKVQTLSDQYLKSADVIIALSQENYNYLKHSYKNIPSKVRILMVSPIIVNHEELYDRALAKIQEGLEQELQSLKK